MFWKLLITHVYNISIWVPYLPPPPGRGGLFVIWLVNRMNLNGAMRFLNLHPIYWSFPCTIWLLTRQLAESIKQETIYLSTVGKSIKTEQTPINCEGVCRGICMTVTCWVYKEVEHSPVNSTVEESIKRKNTHQSSLSRGQTLTDFCIQFACRRYVLHAVLKHVRF